MRIPKDRVSNVNNIHSHTCIKHHFKSGFTDQNKCKQIPLNRIHFPYQTNIHHNLKCIVKVHGEPKT